MVPFGAVTTGASAGSIVSAAVRLRTLPTMVYAIWLRSTLARRSPPRPRSWCPSERVMTRLGRSLRPRPEPDALPLVSAPDSKLRLIFLGATQRVNGERIGKVEARLPGDAGEILP